MSKEVFALFKFSALPSASISFPRKRQTIQRQQTKYYEDDINPSFVGTRERIKQAGPWRAMQAEEGGRHTYTVTVIYYPKIQKADPMKEESVLASPSWRSHGLKRKGTGTLEKDGSRKVTEASPQNKN